MEDDAGGWAGGGVGGWVGRGELGPDRPRRPPSPTSRPAPLPISSPPHFLPHNILADWLLNFYQSFSGFAKVDDVTEVALRALSRVQVRPRRRCHPARLALQPGCWHA